MRVLRHLFASSRRHFPSATLDAIQHAIAASEHRHHGEIVFAAEGNLSLRDIARGRSARDRAHELFTQLRVWNTEHNTGVLLYLLLADHAIEIVADRGVAKEIPEAEWMPICALMQDYFRRGDYDIVVAMYHDQGHGPIKVLGLESGVNITVGLPMVRTSVDHGTAFDIAGKGVADERSLIEALRQAADLAPR